MTNRLKYINIQKLTGENEFPAWLSFENLSTFLYEHMKPYEDTLSDIERGVSNALSNTGENNTGGFVLLAAQNEKLLGAAVMLRTGMSGYIPENIILFACVHPSSRGQGLGSLLIEKTIEECEGNIKLHVEYDNPAKNLYERLGFNNKYAEMRYNKDQT